MYTGGDELFNKISNWVTDQIYATIPGVGPEKREIIEYGAYMVISEISKIVLLLVIGAFLGLFAYAAASILIFGLLRMTLGGVHARTQWGCIISYSCIVYGPIVLALYTNPNKFVLEGIVIPLAFVIAYLYAPADLPVKPVVSKRQRRRLRVTGFLLLAVLFTAAQFTDPEWFKLIMFMVFIQNLMMTPLVYKITRNQYGSGVHA
jgi:accessory gene regulator B